MNFILEIKQKVKTINFAVTPCEFLNWAVISSKKNWRLQLKIMSN